MKNKNGFTLIEILVVIAVLIITLAGGVVTLSVALPRLSGVVVWEKRVSPEPFPTIIPYRPSPIPTPLPNKIIGPTVGGPVSPGIFEGDLRDLPTISPIPPGYFDCQTDADCYDKQGNPKGVCEVPCQDRAVCRNGTCYKPSIPGAICLAKNTLIDTPQGLISVENIRKGMSVWTMDTQGKRLAAPIIKTAKTPIPNTHKVVHLILEDGRELLASPKHPAANGKTLGQLVPGDILDHSQVITTKLVPYQEGYTYDLLPAGKTGFYWANGVLLKSTLVKGGQCQKQK